MAEFIKVTPRGSTEPRIVLASLKTFYISQGAKVEDATPEEVCEAEPHLRHSAAPQSPRGAKQAEPQKRPTPIGEGEAEARLQEELRAGRERMAASRARREQRIDNHN